jgi:hypothetical protein
MKSFWLSFWMHSMVEYVLKAEQYVLQSFQLRRTSGK